MQWHPNNNTGGGVGPAQSGPNSPPPHAMAKITEFNAKYALVRLGRGLAVCEWVLSPIQLNTSPKAARGHDIVFWQWAAFFQWCAHDTIEIDGKEVEAARYWAKSKHAKRHEYVVFDPPPSSLPSSR